MLAFRPPTAAGLSMFEDAFLRPFFLLWVLYVFSNVFWNILSRAMRTSSTLMVNSLLR